MSATKKVLTFGDIVRRDGNRTISITTPPIRPAPQETVPHDARRATNTTRVASPPTRKSDIPTATFRTVTLTPASEIVLLPVKWAWHKRLPIGALSLVGGREGYGKSTLVFELGAHITLGTLPGEHYGTPKGFIVSATEDDWNRTIAPRLVAAGADLDRVYRINVITPEGVDTALSLPVDITELERVIGDADVAMVLLDPIISKLGDNLDTHKDADVRKALEPLSALAQRTGASICGLIHVNKSSTTDPLTMLMGSRAFAAVARAVLFVMKDPDDENVRIMGQPKNNLGRTDLPTQTFTIEELHVADSVEGPVYASRLVWGDEGKSLSDYIEAAATLGPEDRSAVQEAGDWLSDYIDSKGGSAPSADIKTAGKKVGHSQSTLKRARLKLGVVCESRDFPRETWWTDPTKCLVDGLTVGPISPVGPRLSVVGLTGPTVQIKGPTGAVGSDCVDRQSVQSDQLDQHQGNVVPLDSEPF